MYYSATKGVKAAKYIVVRDNDATQHLYEFGGDYTPRGLA